MIGFLSISRHGRLKALLSPYVDGQVTEAEAARVREHLAGCRECQAGLDGLRMTVELLRGLPALELSRSFGLASVPEPVGEPVFPLWAARVATSATAGMLVVLLMADLLNIVSPAAPVSTAGVMREVVVEAEAVAEAQALAASVAATAPAASPPSAAAVAAAAPSESMEAAPKAAASRAAPVAERSVATAPQVAAAKATPVSEEAEATPVESATTAQPDDKRDGLALPLRELQIAAAAAFVALLGATVWQTRRRRP